MVLDIHHRRYVKLRDQLRDMRVSAGLTQVQLADLLSIDQSYLSRIERGDRFVDVFLFVDWCLACSVDPSTAVVPLAES